MIPPQPPQSHIDSPQSQEPAIVVSPYYTFPPISWWMLVLGAGKVVLDGGEYFRKMTPRNRYRISGPNNPILLSVPLADGRSQQHMPMAEIRIHNDARWQTQHWRTLVSVYNRSPFFGHYESSLQQLFQTPFSHLVHFNRAALRWVMKQMKLELELQETTVYVKDHAGATDIRLGGPEDLLFASPKYYQVFEDRIGFQPDLSILDLLFSEGPNSVTMLGMA